MDTTALAFKAKINNSYESEPSSGSGSSLSDNNDHLGLEIENMDLPRLLKPRIDENALNSKMENADVAATPVRKGEKSNSIMTPAYMSSQESPFLGFSESPFEKIKMHLCDPESKKISHSFSYKLTTEKTKEHFFDTIVIENSCNAVDMPLTSQENPISEGEKTSKLIAVPLTSELSFNGIINSLKGEEDEHTNSGTANECKVNNMGTTTSNAVDAQFSQSFIVRDYNAERSPDLFAEDEDETEAEGEGEGESEVVVIEENDECQTYQEMQNRKPDTLTKDELPNTSLNQSLNCPTESSFADEPTMDYTSESVDLKQILFRNNCKRERELLRRIRKCLSGVPPPPSMTTPQIDLVHMVISRKQEILDFCKTIQETSQGSQLIETSQPVSLFKPTHTLNDVQAMPWRDILGVRYHGLCYNLSKASENNEYLSLSVVERFVGSETNSSYRRSPSSAKKRNARLKLLTQSPGNRLSHLAKRRAVFSSAHLATTSQKSTSSLGPQIVIDKKKLKHRRKATPKRKTPASKKKARKTPSSSARKQLFRCDSNKPGPSRETSKRALFQSPARLLERQLVVPKPQIKPEIATRVEKSKRALFSPDMTGEQSSQSASSAILTQPFESLLKRKRSDASYDDDVDELSAHSSKLLRTSENLTPRTLKIKSQSFCIGAGSSTSSSSSLLLPTSSTTAARAFSHKTFGINGGNSSSSISSTISSNSLYAGYGGSASSLNEKKLSRAHSDMTATTISLTENQRKKLLWAVSQALQEKKITTKHERFKQYASVLARVVRRIFQEYYQRTSTSNSETMLRLAKKYVFFVISGKNADDIYLHVKNQLDESKRMSISRLTGYIGPEEYQKLKQQQQLSQSSLSSSISFRGSMQNLFSNENSLDAFSGKGQPSDSNQQMSVVSQSQATSLGEETWSMEITRSASKHQSIVSNSSRQNSSSKSNLGSLALRENSGQKNFTGKDQRNKSPYASNSGFKASCISLNDSVHAASSAKAKRQILFDS